MRYALRILLLFVAAVIVFTGVFFALVELTPFDAAKLTPSTSPTVIYDKNGHQYATIAAPGGSDLQYSNIPQDLQNALVATEDHNYWKGSSLDIKGIFRAAFVDLWSRQLAQGGSTIQEQLAKIVYLTDQKTFSRKFDQILLGVQINRYFSKQQILTMYLNRVYLGEGTTGVHQAAIKYFGVDLAKNPNSLTLAQAALLAGLPQAPSAYDPLQHPKAALIRRNQVLENMAKYGYITEAKAKATEKLPLGVSPHRLPGDIWSSHPLFAQFLMDYADKNGINYQTLAQGGLKVYTTIDPQVQSAIEQVMEYGNHFAAPVNGEPVPAAAVFVDPSTGGILGAAGARDPSAAHGLDRAYENAQPGSSIKPVLEYGAAVEEGLITPNSILDNQPHDFGGGYIPQNDAPNQPTAVTARYALAYSENVAAVSLMQKVGINNAIKFAEQNGIQFTAKDATHLGIAIGGMQNGVNAVQMAQAYEAFDNQGIQQQEHLVSRIVNAQGQEIYNFSPAAKRVMSAQTAATLTSMMQDVVGYGTGTGAQLPGWGVAGKTGTVQYDEGLTGSHPGWIRIAWFDGYTPNMVGSIYMGWNYDGSSPAYHMTGAPSYQCSQIFGDIVRLAEQGQTPQTFQGPAPQLNTNDSAAVTNLQASWNQSQGGVQLSWQSDVAGQAQFVITRQDVAAGPGQGAGGPGVGNQGQGQGEGGAGGPGGPGAGNQGQGQGQGAGGTGAGNQGQGQGQGGPGQGRNTGLVLGGNGYGSTYDGNTGNTGTATGARFINIAAGGPGAVQLGQTPNLSFVDTTVSVGSTYTYTVQAIDPNTGQAIGQPASITLSVNGGGNTGGGGPNGGPGNTGATTNSTGNGGGGPGQIGNTIGNMIGNLVGGSGSGGTGSGGSGGGTGSGGSGTGSGGGSGGGTGGSGTSNTTGSAGSGNSTTNGTGQ
ncbi:transglycosylase domain-containing protein [Alicyclobacillus ferrooxydans]|uniref:transglycosylase domain-containing protein n=1 Tax=Alicyclobacillus ferrooxydans TaxID=471514 RepID=UPI0006D54E75|nr:transglycosylase domain-containing protein [Alicyclobacillus ferrooxydans]